MKTVYDACEIKGGYTPKNEQLFDSGDIPYFKVSDMNREGNHKYMISTELFLRGSNKVFPAGSIVFPKNGGAVLTNKKRVLASDSVVDLNTGIALPKKGTDSKYLFYFFQNLDFRKFIKEGTLPVLRIKEINELPLYLPDIEEQERIVKILDAAFEKIDRLKENAEKGLQEVKNLWEATLREELKPKEGWKATTMDGVCSITSSLVDPRLPEYKNKLHVGGSNIESYTGKLSNLLTAEQEDLVSNKFYFDQTMVLYNKIRPYLVKIAMPDFDGICSADMYPLKPKNGVITREYLYYVLNSKDFTDYAIMGSARAGMPKVNRDCLFAYSFSIPSIDEQKIIVSKLFQTASICNKLQQKLELELAEYEALKQSVLRKAFSGEL